MVAAALPAGRAPRAPLRVPVDILSSHGIRLTGKTHNVSEGGMFVETALLLPVGSPVRCGVSLTDSPVEVLGRVAWSRPRRVGAAAPVAAGMGIQFVGFDPQARWLLRQVIATAPEPIAGDETERIRRPGMGPLAGAMVFAAVTAATAGAVMAVLESTNTATPTATVTATATDTDTVTDTGTVTDTVTVTEPAAGAAAADTASTITIRTEPTSPAAPGPERTVVRIPLRGEPASLRHFPLASPDGVAILLDGGSAAAPASLPLDTGPVRLVLVRGDGREIRVFTRGGVPRYQVIETGDALRLIIEPPSVARQP